MLKVSLALLVWFSALGTASALAESCRPQDPLVLVADGGGDFRGLSTAVYQAVQARGLPLCVQALCWSHGYLKNIADQIDRSHIEDEGCRLARIVQYVRQNCPCRKIHLMGHSAGTAVILAATDHLPPNSINRIVFLAPTVPSETDLRPALLCARDGIDVYYSKRDIYGRLTRLTLIGQEGHLCPRVAAIHGFCRPCDIPDPLCLYSKLHQYRWHSGLSWTGYRGTHSGGYARDFLYGWVLPPLLDSCPETAAELVDPSLPVDPDSEPETE